MTQARLGGASFFQKIEFTVFFSSATMIFLDNQSLVATSRSNIPYPLEGK